MKKISILLATLTLTLDAHGAVVMKMKQEIFKPNEDKCDMTSMVEKDNGRIDIQCSNRKLSTLMGRKPRQITILENEKKTFYTISGAELDALAKGPMEMMKRDPKIAEQMKRLSPEQKKMMEKMMGGMNPAAKKAELKATSTKKKIGSWDCTVHEIRIDGEVTDELCLSPWRNFPTILPVVESWKQFSSEMVRLNRSPGAKAHEQAMKIGLALETVSYVNKEKMSRLEISEIKNESVPSGSFQVPKDYKKMSTPSGG